MKRLATCLAVALLLAGAARLAAGEIHEAAAAGDVEKVRSLLKAKPDLVNLRELGTTPLHEAARNGRLEVVKLLVAARANINTRDSSGLTPLKLAMGHNRTEVAEWLRQNGGLETVAASPRTNTLPAAKSSPPPVPVKPALPAVEPAKPVPPPAQPSTSPPSPGIPAAPASLPARAPAKPAEPALNPVTFPIHEAAEVGDLEQVKALLKAWPELLEAENEKGLTPLHAAAANARKDVAEALLARRANVRARTRYAWTPLHFAATKGHAPTVTLLLAYGAPVNDKTRNDDTPLLMAARGGHVEVAKLLLEAKAEVNVAEKTTGSMPLHLAVAQGNLPMVELLVAKGADVNAQDEHGDTPLALANFGGHEAITRLLEQRGAREAPTPPLTPTEQSLVDFYRNLDRVLQTGSAQEKRKMTLALLPTRADMQKFFPKHAAQAVKVADEIQREVKAAMDQGLFAPPQEGAIWKVQPAAPSPFVQQCQSKGLIPADVPVYTLSVKRKGRKSSVEAYCFVNGRWIPLPPLARIIPDEALR